MPSEATAAHPALVIATGHDLSVALIGADGLIGASHQPAERGHAERVMDAIRAVLRDHGGGRPPARILVEIGPGSFTGLRIGIAAARALGLGWGALVSGIRSTLLTAAAARARLAPEGRSPALVMLHSGRGQLWVEPFDLVTLQSLGAPAALEHSAAEALAASYPLRCGSGAGPDAPEQAPRAEDARWIGLSALEAPLPLYLRPAAG